MMIPLLTAATAANSPPTAGDATVGFALEGLRAAAGGGSANPPLDGVASLSLKSTAGSATMTVTIKIWVWINALAEWVPYGAHVTAATRGLMNGGNAIDEVVADKLLHTELITGLNNYARIYAEITAIGGTSTAVSLWLHGR
jgi:hypothetical protein